MTAALPEAVAQLADRLPLPDPALIATLSRAELLEAYLQRQLLQGLVANTPAPPTHQEAAPGEAHPAKPEEPEAELLAFAQRQGLPDLEQLDHWRGSRGLSLADLEDLVQFQTRLQRASETLWGPEVPSLFLQERADYDRVVISVVRLADADLATELYFQLQDGELSFTALVEHYAEGHDRTNRGMIGPILVKQLNPLLTKVVRRYPPGVLIPPLDVNGKVHLMRVESLEPARLDGPLHDQLLRQLRSSWLQEQLGRLRERLLIEARETAR
jgi:parvulin-like peptidyl-prolyl isomerase